MKVRDLIQKLQALDLDSDIDILHSAGTYGAEIEDVVMDGECAWIIAD